MDWFEIGIWCENDGLEWFLSFIKENLFLNLQKGFGNPFYHCSLTSNKNGLTIFYWLRDKCKNPPITIRCSGKFFQLGKSPLFVQFLLDICGGFGWRFSVQRVDACIDCFNYPLSSEKIFGIPYPDLEVERKSLPGKQLDVDIVCNKRVGIKEWHCGEGDTRIRVYNKLLENPDYFNCYGVEPILVKKNFQVHIETVWRIEFQMRGETLKNLQLKRPFEKLEQVFQEVMGQMYRRFKTGSFEMSPSSISSYFKREHSDLGRINNHEVLAISHYRQAVTLRKQYFGEVIAMTKRESLLEEVADFEKLSGENSD